MTVWANAGNFSRAQSEFGLVNVEQQRMLRNNNLITSKVMGEKDARSQEADDQRLKAADLSFKKMAADFSKEAAEKAKVGAALQLLGTALKIGVSYGMSKKGKADKVNWSTALKDLTNGVFSYMNKVLELQKIDAEVDAIQEDLNRLNSQRMQTDEAVAALDANPFA